jgi:hypothetical protein
MDGYPVGAICLSDCDTAWAWSGSVGDLQADTSLWLGTRVARVLEFTRTDPGWRCHGSPYLDTDHRNCACTKDREARAGALGLDHRWTLSIYAESDVCRGTSIMAGVGAVLWKPGCIALLLVVNLVLVPREERTLEAAFGQAYLMYKKRVPRWLGQANSLRQEL